MMRPINQCLNSQLLSIYKQGLEIEKYDQLVQQLLPHTLKSACRVASFHRGRLILAVTQTALATELRFFLPELRNQLRQAGLHQLTGIEMQILQPDALSSVMEKKTLSLSPTARDTIKKASENCLYQPLKEAWLKLISTPSDNL